MTGELAGVAAAGEAAGVVTGAAAGGAEESGVTGDAGVVDIVFSLFSKRDCLTHQGAVSDCEVGITGCQPHERRA